MSRGLCDRAIRVRTNQGISYDTLHQNTNRTTHCQLPRANPPHGQPATRHRLHSRRETLHARRASTWLLTELGLDDIAFGLCDLGMGTPELGFVSTREIRELRGPLGLPVERDLHFDADKTLSAYAADAREHGRIVT